MELTKEHIEKVFMDVENVQTNSSFIESKQTITEEEVLEEMKKAYENNN